MKIVILSCLSLLLVSGPGRARQGDRLRVDPLLITQVSEVWSFVAADDNPIWPDWNAETTPILIYRPDVQDVLLNHPYPSDDFVEYGGPLTFGDLPIMLRSGKTLITFDGQNTSREVCGIETLVVADGASRLRVHLQSLLQSDQALDGPLSDEQIDGLLPDPYDLLGLFVHEAFHVHQSRSAPGKGGDELALRSYPTLSVENNVGFALEGRALHDAWAAPDEAGLREAAVRWLAIRNQRRANLSAESARYEDGTEFNEGLAKYIEYRLLEVLEGEIPGEAMHWVRGFHGYDDLSGYRTRLFERMVQNMRGEINVNNDPYGASPLRQRLYFSGMAIGVLLDRLAPDWKEQIFLPGITLTGLLEQALDATDEELAEALTCARSHPDHDALVRSKQELGRAGRKRIEEMVGEIESGRLGTLTIDYSALEEPVIGMSFTPFGIVAIDADRTIYTLTPVSARIGAAGLIRQTEVNPILHDLDKKKFRVGLTRAAPLEQLLKSLRVDRLEDRRAGPLQLTLPGIDLDLQHAVVDWKDGQVTVRLIRAG